ncbi:MAG: transglycosylase SLT domain-containing protein [Myxococcota bacterium]|nr:transglycosylase SLT domain-containing protein [Myxococcota bacterium]
MFREAVVAMESGWPEQTLELTDTPLENSALETYRILIRVRAFIRTGREAQLLSFISSADSTLKRLAESHPVRVEIERVLAETLAKREPIKAATVLSRPFQSSVEWKKAYQIFAAKKQVVEANQVARALLFKVPASSQSIELARSLTLDGVEKLLPNPKERLERLHILLSEHANEQALLEAESLIKFAPCEVRYIQGKALRKIRKYKQALIKLKQAKSHCEKSSEYWMKSSLLAAQVHTIKRQVKAVRRIVADMKKVNPKHSFIDDAMVQLARAHERVGQDEKARAVLAQLLKDFPEGDQAHFAAWRTAYSHIRKKNYRKAAPWLKHLRGRHAPQGKYWLAKGFEKSSPREAIKQYIALIQEHPLTFYSWLALGQLERLDNHQANKIWGTLSELRKSVVGTNNDESSLVLPKTLEVALLLKQVSLKQEAIELVHWWAEKNKSAQDQQKVMSVLHKLEDFSGAQHILRWQFPELLDTSLEELSGTAWKLAYSLAYSKAIRRAANKEKIDPLFLFALSREESTFDPSIVSWAGAMGLFQLMPATGIGAYADVYRKRLTDTQKLLDPELNARLGSYVLGQGLKKFRGNKALALAAYNAGPGYAQKTLPKKEVVPFDEWVESVGIKETRRYIKKVLQTWGRYRFIHGGENWRPEWPTQVLPKTGGSIKSGARY